jgi:putative SOS response-associated peptidase YedK
MCGRLNIISDPLTAAVCEQLGIKFSSVDNRDLCPTQQVSAIGKAQNKVSQVNFSWGIKPDWATRMIINAQAETVSVKPTFRQAFSLNRVVVPVSGWYEWTNKENGGKQKWLFESEVDDALYMAAIAYEDHRSLVTITTKPSSQYACYHHRMPLLIAPNMVKTWIENQADAISLLSYHLPMPLRVSAVS